MLVPSYKKGKQHRGVKQPLDNSTICFPRVWHRQQCFKITLPRKKAVTTENTGEITKGGLPE